MQTASLEAPRGVRRVSVRAGFAQVKVEAGGGPSPKWTVEILECLAQANVSHKFLKLNQSGLSFVVVSEAVPATKSALADKPSSLHQGVAIVTIECANVREIPGLVASIASQALDRKIDILHSGDMHDRVYLVVRESDVDRAVSALSGEMK